MPVIQPAPPPAHGARHPWTPTTKRSASAKLGAHIIFPQPNRLGPGGTESPPPPLFLLDDSQCCARGEGHKIHIPPTLKQHAQNQIKLHSKTGTEFPLGGGGKAVTEKESQGKEILLCAVLSGLVLRSVHQNSSLGGCLPEGLHPNHLQSNVSLPLGLSGGQTFLSPYRSPGG